MMLVNVITENLVNSGSLVLLFLAGVSVVTVSSPVLIATKKLIRSQRQNLISDFVLIWRSFCRFVGTFISTVEHLLRGADAIDRAYRKVSSQHEIRNRFVDLIVTVKWKSISDSHSRADTPHGDVSAALGGHQQGTSRCALTACCGERRRY